MTSLDNRVAVSADITSVSNALPAWQQGYARRLVAVDLVGVLLAVGLAHWLRFGELAGTGQPFKYANYLVVSIVIAVSWMLTLSINHSRSPRVVGSGAEEYRPRVDRDGHRVRQCCGHLNAVQA